MIRKIFLPSTLILLTYAFWSSPTFKEIAAGVGILLIGMVMLEEGFKAFTQGPLEKIIRRATNKLYKSLGIGFITTALLQSSSLISVVVISFISAGLLTLHAGIGVIFGANLGTTATAWLVAYFGLKIKISTLAMPMLAFGALLILQNKQSLKAIGNVMAGLGLFFLGVFFMKEGFDAYKESIDLAQYSMPGFWGLIVFTGIGIMMTLILQSSSATLALILTALAASQITYANALALAIGANVGTTITAVLGALSANVEGKRLAGAHFIFNMVTGLVALVFIYQLGAIVNFLAEKLAISETNYTLKLAIFHTLFNLIGVIIMVPFIKPMVKLLKKIFVDKQEAGLETPKYLNKVVLEYPSTAVKALLDETKRLFEGPAYKIAAHGLNLHRGDIESDLKPKKVVRSSTDIIEIDIDDVYYTKVKSIYSHILEFGTKIQSLFTLSKRKAEDINKIKVANRLIVEAIKDSRDLKENVDKYMLSDNKYICKEYDDLRKKMTKVLRVVYELRTEEHPDIYLSEIEKLKEKVQKSDILVDGTLDKLIRKELITSDMATSLANDSNSVADICKNLLDAAELLYIDSTTILGDFDEKKKKKK